MGKPARCLNFPFFSVFTPTTPPVDPPPLSAHKRLYNSLFSPDNPHTSGYDVLFNDFDDPAFAPHLHTHTKHHSV